jgi:hypothetical protein
MAVTTAVCGLRGTVLDEGAYLRALDHNNIYERVYLDFLQSVDEADTVENLLGGVQAGGDDVDEVLRRVLPPEYLRAEVERNVRELLAYLRNDRRDIDLAVDLTPVLDRIGPVAGDYAAARLRAARVVEVDGYAAFVASTAAVLAGLREGRLPAEVPSSAGLTEAEREEAVDLVFGEGTAGPARAAVEAALARGQTGEALAIIAPAVIADRVERSVALLRAELGPGDRLDLIERVAEDQGLTRQEVVDGFGPARTTASFLDTWAVVPGLIVLVLCAGFIALLFLPGWRGPAMAAGILLGAVGLAGLAGWFVHATIAPGQVRAAVLDGEFSTAEMRLMTADVAESLVRSSSGSTWQPGAIALGLGVVLVVGAVAGTQRE